jgi:hypothetical protein
MADTSTPGKNTIHNPTDYQLEAINLMTSTQDGPVNLMGFLVELNLFEDIYGSSISGQIMLNDALGLISNFSLSGTEFIQIKLKKTVKDQFSFSRNFRVYKITNRVTTESNNAELYTLNFCSEELLVSEQYRISKAFKGKKISEIITSILKDYLKVGTGNTKKISISATQGTYDFVLPNKKIFDTISWLSTYALPLPGVGVGADMLFFENADGYWFKSLQELYKQTVYRTFKYDPKNISDDLNQKVSNVYNFEVLDLFNTLGAISNGTFSNRVISIDPLLRTSKETDFNYDTYFGKSKNLNKASLTNNYKNRINKTMYDAPPKDLQAGTLRMVTTNSNQKKQPFIAGKPNSVGNDIFVETFMPNRVAQIALANYMRIKITVPGDPNLAVGKLIDFEIYAATPSDYTTVKNKSNRIPDSLYSGKYVISALRHILRNNSYITVMELCKESNVTAYAGFDNSNAALKNLVNGNQV